MDFELDPDQRAIGDAVAALLAKHAGWERAAARTPHGQPVRLENADR